MKQRIFIAVVPGAAAQHLLGCAPRMLAEGTVVDYFEQLISSDRLLFYSNHLDFWSMGDSFNRFLRPRSKLETFTGASSQLFAIRRALLQLRAAARDDEERLFRELLRSAKSIYRQPPSESFLFVLRQVFGCSGDIFLEPNRARDDQSARFDSA